MKRLLTNFFDISSHEKGLVKLIYDDELTLPGNKKPFKQWLEEINKEITFGSRICFTHNIYLKNDYFETSAAEIHSERLDERYTNAKYSDKPYLYNMPPLPQEGLYYVEIIKTKRTVPVEIDNPLFDPTKKETKRHFTLTTIPGIYNYKNKYSNIELEKENPRTISKFKLNKQNMKSYLNLELNNVDENNILEVINYLNNILIPTMQKTDWDNLNNFVEIEYEDKITNQMCIKYNPKDEIRNMWDYYDDGHERKNRISWKIFNSDQFIINYDEITIEDIDFYLESRTDRREYLYMMPLLWEVRKTLLKEQDEEKDFKKLLQGEIFKQTTIMIDDKMINDHVESWKKDLKWKRAIKHNDQKALRMISKALIKKITKGS